jgi:hypothetical protein
LISTRKSLPQLVEIRVFAHFYYLEPSHQAGTRIRVLCYEIHNPFPANNMHQGCIISIRDIVKLFSRIAGVGEKVICAMSDNVEFT